ncbi:hypothetical protein BJD99_08690 [Rhodococcus sp. 1163]|nr:hypothetical protein BJD99_08690 [Rhodococcus sp. 1163]
MSVRRADRAASSILIGMSAPSWIRRLGTTAGESIGTHRQERGVTSRAAVVRINAAEFLE